MPNGDEAKLVIAQKKTEDNDGYVWLDGAKQYPDRKHPPYLIPPGDYEVEVRIQAISVDQSFVFLL